MKKMMQWVMAAILICGSTTAGGTIYTSFDSDYTYTIADGHIVELVDVKTVVTKIGMIERSQTRTTTTTLTYEEY